MMAGMSRLLVDYGLNVWIWYPAMDKDYSDPQTVALALQEWDGVFRKLPRLDAVFVPGGDPGHTPPPVLMPFLARVAEVLHRSHPRAALWVSPQGYDGAVPVACPLHGANSIFPIMIRSVGLPSDPFSTRALPSSAQYRGTAARARESLASYTSVCSWHPSLPMASTGHSSRAARQEACWAGSWGW
jgi:hypothetical protein